MAYGCLMECIPLAIEATNTHREKPKVRLKEKNCFKKFILELST